MFETIRETWDSCLVSQGICHFSMGYINKTRGERKISTWDIVSIAFFPKISLKMHFI